MIIKRTKNPTTIKLDYSFDMLNMIVDQPSSVMHWKIVIKL